LEFCGIISAIRQKIKDFRKKSIPVLKKQRLPQVLKKQRSPPVLKRQRLPNQV